MAGRRRVTSNTGSRGGDVGISECIEDWKKYKGLLEKGFDWFGEAAEELLVSQQEFADLFPEGIDNMELQLSELASLHYDVDNLTKTLDKFRSVLAEPDLHADKNLSDQFTSTLEAVRQDNVANPKNHPLLVAFKQNVCSHDDSHDSDAHTILLGEGEELGMGRVEKSTLCPLSRTTMINPVRNKTCGHTYSKEAVLSHIRNVLNKPNKREEDVKCPVGGCPSCVLERDLERDEDVEKLLRKAQRQRRNNNVSSIAV